MNLLSALCEKSHICVPIDFCFISRRVFANILQIQKQKRQIFIESKCNRLNFKDQMSIRSTVGSVLNRNRGSNLEAEREAIVQKGSQEKFESKNHTKIIDISISIYN